MQVPYPLCLDCAFFDNKNKKNGKPVCKAFPDGISDETIKERNKFSTDKNSICGNGYKFKHK